MNGKRVLVSLFIVTTVGFVMLIAFQVIRMRHSGPENINQQGPEMFVKWESQQFLPIQAGTQFSSNVESALNTRTVDANLNSAEKNKLVESVENLLLAFSTGNYEDYKKFRFPITDGTFDTNRISSLFQSLSDYDPKFKKYTFNPEDPEFSWNVYKRFWIFSGVETNIYCSKCWREASIQSLNVRVFAGVNKVPELKSIIGLDENVGINWWHPAFNFTPSEEQIINKYKSIDVAVVSLIIKTEPTRRVPDEMAATPVYTLFYWAPEKQVWLPGAFGGAYSGPRKALYLF